MTDNVKKVLIVDDSALMRRIVCDIIESDSRFAVRDMAANGEEALKLLQVHSYDAMVLDIEMPKKDGLSVLEEIGKRGIRISVIIFSGINTKGTDITIRALELGAFDFIRKPTAMIGIKSPKFAKRFLEILACAVKAGEGMSGAEEKPGAEMSDGAEHARARSSQKERPIVAIASSTGGPKALHSVIPALPKNLGCPVLIVQHMPAGFTGSLAKRLDELSEIHVKEAQDGDVLEPNTAYIARGGHHMEIVQKGKAAVIALKDGPTREGVKPCANFMYESLARTEYDFVVCAVLTGMGVDGSEGILNLSKEKPVQVIAQDEETSVVYGMPRSVVSSGLADQIEPINHVAEAIINSVGVK